MHALEMPVEFLNAVLTEVRGEKEMAAFRLDPGQPHEDRAILRFIDLVQSGRLAGSRNRCCRRAPTGDRAVLGCKNESGWIAARQGKIGGGVEEQYRPGGQASWQRRRGERYDQREQA